MSINVVTSVEERNVEAQYLNKTTNSGFITRKSTTKKELNKSNSSRLMAVTLPKTKNLRYFR